VNEVAIELTQSSVFDLVRLPNWIRMSSISERSPDRLCHVVPIIGVGVNCTVLR